jgi:hypothetical protein
MNLGPTSSSPLHFALLIPFLPEVRSAAPDTSSKYARLICSVAADGFINFETGPVWSLALAPDGRYLYAPDTADDRRENSG